MNPLATMVGVVVMLVLAVVAGGLSARPALPSKRALHHAVAAIAAEPGSASAREAVQTVVFLSPRLAAADAATHEHIHHVLHHHLAVLLAPPAPERRDLLLAARAVSANGTWRWLPPRMRTTISEHLRPEPGAGPVTVLAIVLTALLLPGAAVLWALLRGPRPVDPQAETLENVEPVDVDTQDITIDGGPSTVHTPLSTTQRSLPPPP